MIGKRQRLAAFKAYRKHVMSSPTDDMERVWKEAREVAYRTARRFGASHVMASDYADRAHNWFIKWINGTGPGEPWRAE